MADPKVTPLHGVTLHDKLNDLIETARAEAEAIKAKIEDSSSLSGIEAGVLIARAKAIIEALEQYMRLNTPHG